MKNQNETSPRKSIKPELSDIFEKINSQDSKTVFEGLKNLVINQAQGEDCSSILNNVASINTGRSIKMRRYRNIILGDSYTGIGTISADIQSDNYLLQSFAVKRAGLVTTAESGDLLIPIIEEASKSADPRLREAACFAILKVEKNDTSLIELYKLNETLQRLLADDVIGVAANAASVILEINQGRSKPLFKATSETVFKLVSCMQDATEWCKIQILDFVNDFMPANRVEAISILEKLKPHLYNANSSVTIGIVKFCVKISRVLENKEEIKFLIQELLPPLVKLMSSAPEIQLVVLRTILVLFQQFDFLRTTNVAAFFCKANEPSYIQIAKLDIVQILTNEGNVESVIKELKSYCLSPNQTIAKKSISELGRIALFFEHAADTCVDCFIDLIENSEENVMEQCICESVNIIRHYQGKYENLIEMILERTEGEVEEPSTKSALVWILGQYCEMQGAANLLDSVFIENFLEETTEVQLAILTAVIKTYIADPDYGADMLNRVMPLATCEVDDPDVRDRAYSYMKLLVEVPDYADQIITNQESQAIHPKTIVNKKLVESLLPCLGSISTVLRKFPAEFRIREKNMVVMPLLLDRNPKLYDVVIRGQFQVTDKDERQIILKLKNMGSIPLPIVQIEFKYNTFGFVPRSMLNLPKIEKKQSATIVLPVSIQKSFIDSKQEVSNNIKIEIKVNQPASISFRCAMPLGFLLEPENKGKFTREAFNEEWPKVKKEDEQIYNIHSPSITTLDAAKEAFRKERVFFFAKKDDNAFFSGRMITNDAFIVIIRFLKEGNCTVVLRMLNNNMRNLILGLVSQVLQ